MILTGVDHYQVVFTLPNQLSRLALGNRVQIYDLLFSAAWSALQRAIDAEQGFDPAALMVLHTWNQKLEAHAHVHAVVPELQSVEWGSYIEPPPHADCRPEQVLKYLARYLTGGPISDSRIMSADEHQVTFLAREGQVTGGQRQQVPITITSLEFTRCWVLHILPKGYTKVRRFGGWSNRRTAEYIERCAVLLDGVGAKLTPQAVLFDPSLWELESDAENEFTEAECPHCGAALRQTAARPKPSWVDVMHSPHRPSWYARGRLKTLNLVAIVPGRGIEFA